MPEATVMKSITCFLILFMSLTGTWLQAENWINSASIFSPTGAGILADKFKGTVVSAERKSYEFVLKVEAESKHVITYSINGPIEAFDVLAANYPVGSTHEFTPSVHGLRMEKGFSDQIRAWGHCPARILKSGSGGTKLITAVRFDGETLTLKHKEPEEPTKEFKNLDEHLEDETDYDFPEALNSALAGQKPAHQAPDLSVEHVRTLSRYLGQWTGQIKDQPNGRIELSCRWSANGNSIWRTMKWADESMNRTFYSVHLLAYDPKGGTYIEDGTQTGAASRVRHRWDEKTKSFATETLEQSDGYTKTTVATFSTDDRIDWKTTYRNQSGAEMTTVGRYDRVKK